MKIYATLAVAFAIGTALNSIAAASESATCTEFYEKAQEEKTSGHLNAALVHLRICIDAGCPKFIRDDCMRWMDQVEGALPSVVFAVRRDGSDVTGAEVLCDGKILVSSLDGKAVSVDPGPHDFSFSLPGFPSIQRQTIIREGERNRIIEVEFSSRITAAATHAPTTTDISLQNVQDEPVEQETGRRYLPYGLVGLSALGAAGFAVFAIQGNSRKGDLERTCSPSCPSSQVAEVKTKYMLADACLAVGIVSLGVATYLFLTSHSEGAGSQASTTSIGFALQASGSGGVVQIATPF